MKTSVKTKTITLLLVICMIFGIGAPSVMAKSAKTSTIKSVTLKVDNKKVYKKTINITVGAKKRLKLSVSPKSIKKTVSFKSTNKKVAIVNKKGVVTAKKVGKSTIKVTVKSGKEKKTAFVKINVAKRKTTNTSTKPTVANTTKTEKATTATTAKGKNSLVVYFSCTDNTKTIAEYVKDSANADIYRIVPQTPYTSADLNYGNSNSRTSKEQNDDSARPKIAGKLPNISNYDYIYIGYPIWWGEAPKIMYTFVESVNLKGKTVIPFCTSASSGIGSSATNLKKVDSSNAKWLTGRRFSGSTPKNTVDSWVSGIKF